MKIKDLIKKSHEIANEKGFWKEYDTIIKKMKNDNYSNEEIESVKNSFINQKIMYLYIFKKIDLKMNYQM